jgi:hypothetical protein
MNDLLLERRRHEKAGCRVSASGLIDARCRSCREYDDLTKMYTSLGWYPTDYDLKLLKSLRISPR